MSLRTVWNTGIRKCPSCKRPIPAINVPYGCKLVAQCPHRDSTIEMKRCASKDQDKQRWELPWYERFRSKSTQKEETQ